MTKTVVLIVHILVAKLENIVPDRCSEEIEHMPPSGC